MTQQTPAPGEMYLYDDAIPPLDDGQHQITVTTKLTGGPPDATVPDAVLTVEVTGPQFRLPAGEVITVEPPAASAGIDPNVLPNIVLRRQTLPWERTASSSASATRIPWPALLVLDGSEISATAISRNVAVSSLPATALQGAVDTSGVCDTLQLDASVAAAVLPTAGDLRLLCHVRLVNTAERDMGPQTSDGCFAVVLANRLPNPNPGVLTHACLVSLENRSDVLTLLGTTVPATAPPVTLVLLSDWTFTTGPDLSFGHLTGNVAAHAAALAHSHAQPTLLPYTGRDGVQTTAAYHGPLTGNAAAQPPVGGPRDVSLAAAGQLGRLLAAADRAQVKAISDWQRADLLTPTATTAQATSAAQQGHAALPMPQRLRAGAQAAVRALSRLGQPPITRWTSTPLPRNSTPLPRNSTQPAQPSLAPPPARPNAIGRPR